MSNDELSDVVRNIQGEMRQLGIHPYPDKNSLRRLIGDPPKNRISIQGKQVLQRQHGPHPVDYTLHLDRHKNPLMSDYYPTSLIVKVNEPNAASRTFNLKGDEYFSLHQAVNLLAGRAVYKLYFGENRIMPAWHRLNNAQVDLAGNAHIQRFPHLTDSIESALDSLPINSLSTMREDILDSLFNGDLVEVSWQDNKNAMPAYIQVDPEHKTIASFSRPVSKDLNLSNASRKSINPKGRNRGI